MITLKCFPCRKTSNAIFDPFFYTNCIKKVLEVHFIHSDPQLFSKIFNWMQVRRFTGLFQEFYYLPLEPIKSFLGCVFRITIMEIHTDVL